MGIKGDLGCAGIVACSIGEMSADKQFQMAVMTLVVELLILGMVEMVCHAVRQNRL